MRIDDAAITTATRTTEAGAITGVVGWAAQVNWIGLTGIFIAALGLIANLWFQRRRDARERQEEARRIEMHEEKLRAIRRGENVQ